MSALGAIVFVSPVYAVGTDEGTTLSTTFEIDYTVGTQAQTQLTPTSQDFIVGRKIDLTVTANSATWNMTPLGTDQAMSFDLANTGNATQGFGLTPSVVTDTDDILDDASIQIYIEDGTDDSTFNASEDDLYVAGSTVLDLAEDGVQRIWIVIDANDGADGDVATVNLLATAYDEGSATDVAQSDSADAFDPNSSQTVFSDEAGDAAGDTQYDGSHSADSDFVFAAAILEVTPNMLILYDNNTGAWTCNTMLTSAAVTNAKAIPGSCIHFTYNIANTGSTDATSVVWTSTLPTGLSYEGVSSGEGEDTLNAASCDTSYGESSGVITCSITNLEAGTDVDIEFRASID